MIRRLWMRLMRWIARRLIARASRVAPDFVVGGEAGPYLRRWYLTPWRHWLSYHDRAKGWRRWLSWPARLLPQVYLHQFLRPDDDRALHDHPWPWMSIMLEGEYLEVLPDSAVLRRMGSIAMRGPRVPHRVSLQVDAHGIHRPCWTLFITGPRMRNWGFICPDRGWVPWQQFTAAGSGKPGEIGPGCEP